MIIGIDGNEANVKNRLGSGQYAFQMIKHLYKSGADNQYIVYLKEPPLKHLPRPKKNFHYLVFGPKKLWTRLALPLRLYTKKPKLDIFYSPGHYTPSFSPYPTLPTIHDIGYLDSPKQFSQKDYQQLKTWTAQSIKKSPHILTSSQFTKTEIQRIYQIPSNKITLVVNGVEKPPKITPKQSQAILQKLTIENPIKKDFFLCLGTLKPNKNIPFLIKAFSQFVKKNPGYQLVIAGKKGWLFEDIFSLVKSLKLEKQVIFTGFVTDNQKWSLYQNATALIIPSLYEGFGRPTIEAMKVKCPVIASHIPSLKEVVGQAGLFIDPNNINSLVNAINQIIQPKTRNRLIKLGLVQSKKYNWQKSAKILINTLHQNLSAKAG